MFEGTIDFEMFYGIYVDLKKMNNRITELQRDFDFSQHELGEAYDRIKELEEKVALLEKVAS